MSRRVLVAGIGNLLLSDDGFGVEVANQLAARPLLPGVRVADFGIRGVHLAFELLEGYDALILIDAVPMQEPPGTIAVIEPEDNGRLTAGDGAAGDGAVPVVDAHSMSPETVLQTLAHLGGTIERVLVVGCQPATLGEGIGLSPAVAGAVEGAVELCVQLVVEMAQPAGKGITG